jgi:ribosomal protein S18 acetylase RimI-like enzyme
MTIDPERLAARRKSASSPLRAEKAADVAAAARLLSDAFADDPVADYFLRADGGRETARRRFFGLIAKVGAEVGAVWLVRDGETALAASIWAPPPGIVTTSIVEEIAMAPVFLSVSGLKRLPRLLRLREAMDARHPKAPHWYLFFLGVSPAAQGQGLGAALLGANLATVDSEAGAAYLENSNPRNRGLYERAGFEEVSAFRPERTGPLLNGMWRHPRR